MGKKSKKVHDLSDKLMNVKTRPAMAEADWIVAGKPYWLVAVATPSGPDTFDYVYYRTYVPACQKLDVWIRTVERTSGLYAGTIVGSDNAMQVVDGIVYPWESEEAKDASPGAGHTSKLYLTWDRSLNEANAQRYDRSEDAA